MLERDSYPLLKTTDINHLIEPEYSIEGETQPQADEISIEIKRILSYYNQFLENHWIPSVESCRIFLYKNDPIFLYSGFGTRKFQ